MWNGGLLPQVASEHVASKHRWFAGRRGFRTGSTVQITLPKNTDRILACSFDKMLECCYGCWYCKSTNLGVLLYLVNLANLVFSLIFVAANIRK